MQQSERVGFRYGVLGAFTELWHAVKDNGFFAMYGINFMPAMPPNIPQTEAIDGISAVCAKPENAKIGIFQAMVLFVQKVSGMSEPEIEQQASTFRKLANNPEGKDEKK